MNPKVIDVINSLKKNGFNAQYFESKEDVINKILEEINQKEDVGIGGSMTVYELELHKHLIDRGNKVYWHWLVEPDNRDEERTKASKAHVYICSSNAITLDGKLVNIDGLGNRVSSMIYGHERVFIITGINKLSNDVDDAIKRIKEIACPKNAERLNLDTPCRYTGKCTNCNSKDTMCNVTVILDRHPMQGNINVYIVNENLGY